MVRRIVWAGAGAGLRQADLQRHCWLLASDRVSSPRLFGRQPMFEQECLRVAASLRASISLYEIKLSPTSVLARMVAVSERAGRDGVLESQDEEQVRLLGQAQHVAQCLERLRAVRGGENLTRWLKRSLDRI